MNPSSVRPPAPRLRWLALVLLVAACRPPLEAKLLAGEEAARAGRWADARKAFDEAAALDPKSAVVQVRRGIALFELGQKAEAATAWTQALALDPQAEEAAEGLARLELEAHDAGAAVSQLSAVTNPSRAAFQATLARALLARGGPDDAAAALAAAQKALAALPGDPDLEYLVGCALVALHRYGDAQSTLEGLLRRHPESPLGSYGLARLAAAQSRPTDALLHLSTAKAAAGSGWNPAQVAADPAFAFLSSAPEFKALLQ